MSAAQSNSLTATLLLSRREICERVLIAPPDLRLADPQIALEIYYGRFPLSGHLVETGGLSPFQLDVAHDGWVRSLHGFRWLRHMRAASTELAAANARALVSDWISAHSTRILGVAWEPATTGPPTARAERSRHG